MYNRVITRTPVFSIGADVHYAMAKANLLYILETVARAPGCPQKTFIVQCGSAPLSQEGNTMFGPGEYRPDPSAGITAPADLPQPEIVPYSRNDLRQSC